MKDCNKIEKLLWDFADGSISAENRILIDSHLAQCPQCSQGLQTIKALGGLSEFDEKRIAKIDINKFDNAVFDKIKSQKQTISVRIAPKVNYHFRMALSFGMAIVIVMFLVRSMQDINIPMFKPDTTASEEKEYKIMNFNFTDKKESG